MENKKIDLIYCAQGNVKFAQIAIDCGFLYGSRLPATVYRNIYFADQNWKKPDKDSYIRAIRKHSPHIATVLDWEKWSQYAEVMEWAEEIAPFVEEVLVVPKIPNSVQSIPEKIGGKKIRIAYSVPTRYGGSTISLQELQNREIHLLGGSPHAQMSLYKKINNVVSADGNYHQKIAIMNKVWVFGAKRVMGRWERLDDYLGHRIEEDAIYKSFELSSINIKKAWEIIIKNDI